MADPHAPPPPVPPQKPAFDLLADPARWPPQLQQPADRPIERVDTHGAAVFLGDSYVLKAKRAVRFSFLDFTTPDRRGEACRTELRLNRRTAPEMYLDLAAVVRDGEGGLAILPSAAEADRPAVVEWLVLMRRFDRGGLLRDMAQEGRLTMAVCEQVAAEIAALHLSEAPRFDMGGPDETGRTLEGALAEIDGQGAGILSERDCRAAAAALRQALSAGSALLERRQGQGYVRHVHGDMHLGNVCMFGGRPLLFDCIEFNERFAVIDLLYDLAFLLMDLWHLGCRAEANRVLNLWLEALHALPERLTGLALLPLFLALRAAIRTHVHCSIAAVRDEAAAREREAETARGYLAAVRAYLAPQPAVLVGIGGVSGTGKSSVARALAPHLGRIPGAVVLRSDAIRKILWGVAPTEKLPEQAYARAHAETVYAGLRRQAQEALRAGHAVIADAVHAGPDEREALARLARDCGVPFRGLWLEAPDAVLRARLDARRGDVSDADSAVLARQRGYDLGTVDWTRVDASGAPEAVLAAARAALPAGWRRPQGDAAAPAAGNGVD